MAEESSRAEATPMITLERVNTPPAQTWNYLKANDITLEVPKLSRKGDVYFALPALFKKIECGMGDKVTSWVTSQAADATYIEVKAHTQREEPIVIDIDSDAGEVKDTGVMVREGATATIVVVAHGASQEDQTSGALLRIIAEADSKVTLIELVAEGESHQHLESIGIDADDDAHIEIHQYFLGAKTTAAGICTRLSGDNAHVDLKSHYLGRGTETLDINHVVRMAGKNGHAEVHESGVLGDEAHKTLKATIDLIHGASGSKGNEAETVLVNGDGVVNKTMPVILCDEDDVQGNHGATIGSVGEDQMAYLTTRGLSRSEAESLFVRALFDDALITCATTGARQAIHARAAEVLGADVADDLLDTLGIELQKTAEVAEQAASDTHEGA